MFQIATRYSDLGKFEEALKYIDMCLGMIEGPSNDKCGLVRAQVLLWLDKLDECEKEILKLE